MAFFVHLCNRLPLVVSAYSSLAFILLFVSWYLKFSSGQKSESTQSELWSEQLSKDISTKITSVTIALRLILSDYLSAVELLSLLRYFKEMLGENNEKPSEKEQMGRAPQEFFPLFLSLCCIRGMQA